MAGKNRGRRPGKNQPTAAVESSAVELESFNPELGPLDVPQPDPLDLEILEAPGTATLAVSADLYERAMDFAGQAAAPNTVRAYRSDWNAFKVWAAPNGLEVLPVEPSALALYATTLAGAGKKCSTISRALAAVNHAQDRRP